MSKSPVTMLIVGVVALFAFLAAWWVGSNSITDSSVTDVDSRSSLGSDSLAGNTNEGGLGDLVQDYQNLSDGKQDDSDILNAEGLAMPGQAILKASDREQYQRMLLDANRHGVKIMRRLNALMAVQVKITDRDRFADWVRKNDLQASPNYVVYTPPVPEFEASSLDSFTGIGAQLAQWLGVEGRSGAGVTVAVLDSGISTHPAFTGSTIVRLDGAAESYENGHGTAVASLIAGNHPQATGVAPGVTLLDYPVINEQGIGDTFLLAENIIAAADAEPPLMNLSLGSTGDSLLVREAIEYAQAKGVIIVAAAGNEGVAQLAYPANLPGVIAVGAVDANNQVLPFSNQGAGLDVVAPGYGIQAAWPNERLVQFSGTSGSVPIVTGALAVLLSQEPNLSAEEAVTILQTYSDEGGVAGDDSEYGFGVLNLDRMLNRNVTGIYDVAVASQYVTGGEQPQLNVVVENQGTETINGIHVQTVVNGAPSSQFVQQLKPGEHEVRLFNYNASNLNEVKITSEVSGGYVDGDASNDLLQSVIISEEN